MRKLLFLIQCCILLWGEVIAQGVNEVVRFDYYVDSTDNDFKNRFHNGTGLQQIQTNGITGGCLETPLTVSWGNDNAIYCTYIKAVIGEGLDLSISFKYDTTQLNNINFDRSVSLWMKPYVDPNHYIIASVLDTKRIQIVSYSATSNSPVLQLVHDHWYNLVMTIVFTGGALHDEINISTQVNDLGLTGNDPPTQIGYTNTDLHDSIMIADTSIEASVTAAHWGGALYLDDFQFVGRRSYDNCISTAVEEFATENIQTFVNGSELAVLTGSIQSGRIEIHDLQGKKLAEKKINSEKTILDISYMPPGVYFFSIQNEKRFLTKKFILQ